MRTHTYADTTCRNIWMVCRMYVKRRLNMVWKGHFKNWEASVRPLDNAPSYIASPRSVLLGSFARCHFNLAFEVCLQESKHASLACFFRSTNTGNCHMLIDFLLLRCCRGKHHIRALQKQRRGCSSPSRISGDLYIRTLHERWPRIVICVNVLSISLCCS